MIRSSLITVRLFLMLLVLISGIFGSIYWLTVPLIKDNVFGLELHTNRQVLNIVYDLASRMYDTTETYIDNTLAAHESRLDSILEMAEKYIQISLDEGRQQGEREEITWHRLYGNLRQFEFGNNDYIWASDYNARLISHPAPQFHQRDMSEFADPEGTVIIPEIVAFARQQKQGLYQYKWSRLGSDQVVDKYSFVRDYPQWGLVMGAGVYIEDVQQEVVRQKNKAILEINKALREVKIANNGYLFVFDSNGNMLFHPNSNIHGVNFKQQLNPVTQRPIYLDLIAVADTGEELYYKWDKPNDPGNYNYEKLSLVRYLPGFDWYISSSVYVEDLRSSSVQLSQRIKAMGLLALLSALIAAFVFAQWLTSPIKKLSSTAYKISRGDLSAKTEIVRDDELGLLAESFDYMVDRLRHNITHLDSRVKARTQELSQSNSQLLAAITDLEYAQCELRAVERRQRLILDALPAQVAYLDNQLRYVFANRQYRSVFNQTKESIKGQSLEDVVGHRMFKSLTPYITQARKGQSPIYEYRLQHNGEEIITRRTMMPFINEDGAMEGLLTLSIDITRERAAERKMFEASKMKAVGQLSGGLAHDFNNLLTIILGNLLQLQDIHCSEEKRHKHLSPAIRAARRGGDLTKRLLAFARRQSLSPAWIKPKHMLQDLVDLLAASLPDNVRLRSSVQDEAPTICVDAAQMEDALVNLVLNSVDAMPLGGDISISVFNVDHHHRLITAGGFDDEISPGQYALIRVIDSGSGFSDDALRNAWEPFYTTKSTGQGSGLGLSMVFGFVKQSKGYWRISNDAQDLTGACVDLLLPSEIRSCPGAVIRPDRSEPQRENRSNSKLILLVEDNVDLRKMVCREMVAADYCVIEAATGDEALNLLSGLTDVAGLVSDIVMPGSHDGLAVATAVKAQHPNAFVILMTGYSEMSPTFDFEFDLIQKPFGPDELLRSIRKMQSVAGGHHE